MAVKNSLTEKRKKANQGVAVASYMVGDQHIELTPEIVREYMVSGNKEAVTIQELVMFMNLCKFSGLNPWAKEAYCIKYGSEPATMVVGKETYIKRAEANISFDGFESGIIVVSKSDQEIIHREGCFKLSDEDIIGGWAKVYRKDRSRPYVIEVGFDEYAAKKRDGSLNSMWSNKPGTMIRKVALVQALREAFPSSFGGAFTEEEGEYIVDVTAEAAAPEQIPEQATQRIEQHEVMPQMHAQAPAPEKAPQPAIQSRQVDSDGQAFFV